MTKLNAIMSMLLQKISNVAPIILIILHAFLAGIVFTLIVHNSFTKEKYLYYTNVVEFNGSNETYYSLSSDYDYRTILLQYQDEVKMRETGCISVCPDSARITMYALAKDGNELILEQKTIIP